MAVCTRSVVVSAQAAVALVKELGGTGTNRTGLPDRGRKMAFPPRTMVANHVTASEAFSWSRLDAIAEKRGPGIVVNAGC